MNCKHKGNLLTAAGIVCLSLITCFARGQHKSVRLSLDPGKVTGKIPEGIYGHFLEHINNSVNGGLWGELVWNRSFEESSSSAVPKWEVTGAIKIISDTINPLNSSKSLKLTALKAGEGLSQKNFLLRKGDILKGSIWIKGAAPKGIMIRLVSKGKVLAEQVTAAPGPSWKAFKLLLNPSESADSAVLQVLSLGKSAVWIDQLSLMANSSRATGGFRPDLLKAITDLKPASIRFPGGGFAAGYNWKDGIGPQYKRIGKGKPADIDPLAFGMDEFILLCRKTGAAPVICVPLGKRDNSQLEQYIRLAEEELEYCNGSAATKWGKIRAANGHPEPYHIKYWEIDNELYLTSMTASDYLAAVNKFAAALRKKDPSISLIGCGGGGTSLLSDKGWSLKMLHGDLSGWDYFSLHQYENYSRKPLSADSSRFRTGIDDFEKYYAALRDSIAKGNKKDLKVYESEWNYMSVDWRTGLYAGGILNCFERNSDLVTMACPALFLRHTSAKSWDNALINFDHRTWFPAPNYIIMKLYRDHYAPLRIALNGDSGPLNAVATKSQDGRKLILKIVNANNKGTDLQVDIEGNLNYNQANMQWVAENLDARNTLNNPSAIAVHQQKLTCKGRSIPVNLPPFSVAVIEISKK